VERIAADIYRLSVGNNVVDAQVSRAAAGALLAMFGSEAHRISLGLHLVVDGNTILMYFSLGK
jgi:hypothetical protein